MTEREEILKAAREAALMARVEELEREIAALKADLARYKVGNEHLENALTCAEEALKAQEEK